MLVITSFIITVKFLKLLACQDPICKTLPNIFFFVLFCQPSRDNLEKHIKWGDGFILLYSITDRHSLGQLQDIWEHIERVKGRDVPLVLVGNKSDLLTARQVTADEGSELGSHMDCPKFEMSVAEGCQGVLEVMDELLCQLKRDFVKSLSSANMASIQVEKPRSKLFSMKKAFKKRINKSHSDTF